MHSFYQVITFVEVVERQSFASAARHLQISSAAVSKHVSNLEKRLRLQLLKRSTRKIALTSEGTLYYEHCKRIVNAINEADAAISDVQEEASGVLKVICGPQFGSKYVIPNIRKFLEKYPLVVPMIEFTQTIPDLEKEKVDVIIGLSSSIPVNCIQKRLLFARNVICASPEYLKKQGMPKKINDLHNHRLIAHTLGKAKTIVFANGEEVNLDPILLFNDTRAIRAAVLEGIGIAELHHYIVEEDLKNGTLIELLPKCKEQKNTIPLYVAYPQTDFVHIKVRRFIDFFSQTILKAV